MGTTLVEKIFSKALGKEVNAGDFVVANIDYALAHDGTAPLAIKVFEDFEAFKVWNYEKIIFFIDHIAPSKSESISMLHNIMRNFAQKHNIKLYDVGSGICHQLMIEEGYIKPRSIIVGADSHTCTYGALGAFATGIGSSEIASVFLSGKLWFKIPETIRIELFGSMPKMVEAKDLILYLVGLIGGDGATYKSIEFIGSIVDKMSVDGRLTMCNMAIEMGAKNGLCEVDSKTLRFLGLEKTKDFIDLRSDEDAVYASNLKFDVSKLEPQVACPPFVDNVKPITEVGNIEIDQVFLGSCTNGRLSDLEVAAKILKGKKIKKGVRMLVIPASRNIYLEGLRNGVIDILISSGCVICNPGCGPCAGAHQGVVASGEVCVSTSNRNFVGRMGSTKADVFLVSPATAAASALKGRISDPRCS